ncbi:MAG TPA: SDR family oxidoreductase [Chryseolinea sp.]|nr:SDR family oxidoreductase [Chryseolinea sp.]
MKSFQDQVAIVTGAGQGIGLEICKQLVAGGAKVVLNDIDDDLTAKAAASITNDQNICLPMVGDASNIGFIQRMVLETVRRFGRLDIAIANAGITLFGSFFDYEPEDFNKVLSVNLGGSFFLAQAASIEMKKSGSAGRILFMSSVTGHQAHKNLAAYGMTKAGLEMLAKTLVLELSPYKITINAIAPGATLTERTATDESYEATWSRITPTGRPATVQDIAHAALFLVSPQAGHITGQSLVVDGGWTSTSPSPY